MAIDKILENVLHYIESRFGLFKLELEESVSTAMVKLIQGVVVGVLGVFVILFFSWGIAQVLNGWLNTTFIGHFIVGGIYLLLMLSVVSKAGEQKLRTKIEHTVSRIFEKRKKTIHDTPSVTETKEATMEQEERFYP